MKNRSSFNKLFNRDRKALYIVLSIVIISVLTLTVVYAALSTTLNINGNAEVTAASWDIHLDNVQLNSNSATTTVPTITDSTTATFSTILSKPGDYYMFTIDVVNDGSIDAMIDSVTKTPTLTETQAKYLNYIVEYQNGESINNKQLVSKKSFVRLKVKLEFRKDITASDLPSTSETLNLSFRVNYVQSDDSTENITIDNNGKLVKIVSGDYDTVGSEICIEEECFYVISSDEDSVTMLAKYNLYVGGTHDGTKWTAYGEEATGIQDSTALGARFNSEGKATYFPWNGLSRFSSIDYWSESTKTYPSYVYNTNSTLYQYVENYKKYLEKSGITIENARLINIDELIYLGCEPEKWKCTSAPEWVYDTTYWSGEAQSANHIWIVRSKGDCYGNEKSNNVDSGIRPVITIPKS